MSGRMNRVKDALASVLSDVRAKHDLHPNLYIAGYHNGLALAEHHINMRLGKPVQVEVKAFKVGNAPLAANDPGADYGSEQEYESLVDRILQQVEIVCWSEGDDHAAAVIELGRRKLELNNFVEDMLKEARVNNKAKKTEAVKQAESQLEAQAMGAELVDPL